MKHLMKPLAAVIIGSSVLMTGCMGKFALTSKVYGWNKKVDSNRWINEGIFLAFNIIPVYGLTILGDALIFNSVDWWTGNNPIAAGAQKQIEGEGGSVALMTMRADGAIDVELSTALGTQSRFTLAKQGDTITARDAQGNPMNVVLF